MASLSRLLSRTGKYKRYVAAAIICNILLSIFTVVSIPIIIPFLQILFDKAPAVTDLATDPSATDYLNYYVSRLILDKGKEQALVMVCIGIIILFLLKNIFRYLSLFFMAPLRNGILRDIRGELFAKYLGLPLAFYGSVKKGDLLSRLTTDVMEIEHSILDAIEAIFKSPLIMIGCIAYMLWESPQLTVFVFVLIIFVAVIIGGISRTLKRKSHAVQSLLGTLSTIAEESLGGIRIIKGFGAESYVDDTYRRYNDAHQNTLTRLLWRRDLSGPLSEFLGIVTVTVLLWYGSRMVFDNQLAPESFFAFIFAFFQVIEPSKSFSKAYYNIQKGMASMDRVEQLLQQPNPIREHVGSQQIQHLDKEIVFEGVSFSYLADGPLVLDKVDLTIKKGEVVALVGASGAGKSTLADLLPRFYDVTAGRITIDGIDVREYKLDELRCMFGIVSQEAILFNDTIRNNITFGLECSDAAVREAASVANAHTFITEMPRGYDSLVGDRGSLLSGGQRQRITIARAVVADPSILILDEATSALDAESERIVQQALDEIVVGRTTIIIAHRLSTIRAADKIVVLDKGRIVEVGTHAELVNAEGAYSTFVGMQSIV